MNPNSQVTVRLVLAAAIWLGALFSLVGANHTPVVNAGPDASFRINIKNIYLNGAFSDDSTDSASLLVTWTQIQGPAPSYLDNPNAARARLGFDSTGDYLFQLAVSDGALTGYDTVKLTILPVLPFKVLAPQNLAPVQIGKPFTILWQREPPVACELYYSIDTGQTWNPITTTGSVSTGSFVWNVGSDTVTLTPGMLGIVKVERYQWPNDTAYGTCTLVPASGVVRETAIEYAHVSIMARIDLHGRVKIDGLDYLGLARVEFFDLRGNLRWIGTTVNGTLTECPPGFVFAERPVVRVIVNGITAFTGLCGF